jgi:hypothetical protein
MTTITANELKTRGIGHVESLMKNDDEVGVTVRGKLQYVILPTERYGAAREAEILQAWRETEEAVANGNYTTSIDEHLKRLDDSLKLAK